jgi:enoyl-CoA hydratase/carnithine racemase
MSDEGASLHELQTVLVDRPREGVLMVTLNRPERLNALTFESFDELRRLCSEIEADSSVRTLVVTGAGRGFCSGLDLRDAERLTEMNVSEMLEGQEHWADSIAAFRRLTKPVIAAVNGAAAGAGLALALAADIRIAATEARFNAAFVRIGLTGGDCGVSWFLPRIVGLGQASELLLTGRIIDAQEARRIRLVNKVVSADDLIPAALKLADEVAQNSPFAVRLTKQVLQANVDAPSLEAALELENRNQVLATRTDDMREALNAFLEKRPPRFVDR